MQFNTVQQYPQRNAAPLYLIHTLLALSPYTALNIPLLNCSILYCPTMNCTLVLCTALHKTILHYTAQHYPTLHFIALHCTVLHLTALHCTALHLVGAVLYLIFLTFLNNVCFFLGADICCTAQFVRGYFLMQCRALYFYAVQYGLPLCSAAFCSIPI